MLLEELRALPAKYQTPLVLRYLEGQSRNEIATAIDATPATIVLTANAPPEETDPPTAAIVEASRPEQAERRSGKTDQDSAPAETVSGGLFRPTG